MTTQQRPSYTPSSQPAATTPRHSAPIPSSSSPAIYKPSTQTTPMTNGTLKRKTPPTTACQPTPAKSYPTPPSAAAANPSPTPLGTSTPHQHPRPTDQRPSPAPTEPSADNLTAAALDALEQTLLRTRTTSTHALATAARPTLVCATRTAARARSAERDARAQLSALLLQRRVLDERAAGHARRAAEAERAADVARVEVEGREREADGAEGELMAIALGRMMARVEGRADAEGVWERARGFRDVFLRDGLVEEETVGEQEGEMERGDDGDGDDESC